MRGRKRALMSPLVNDHENMKEFDMALNVGKEVAALKRMTVKQLRARHVEVFGEQPRSSHKDYLIKRIESNPGKYKEWEFDGCSGIPDELMGLFTGCDWQDITYKCCLPHDLAYGYGELENDIERERVDLKFYSDLVTKAGMKKWQASAFLAAVRLGGAEVFGLSFSWGFAHIA